MNSAATWQSIRARRAVPTGAAAYDPDRKKTFAASLRQAEELADASRVAGYAARPLPLFYCLSQAGRAIAAAHLHGTWALQGHGLSVRMGQSGSLLETFIDPKPGKNDSFSGVSTAINSPTLSGRASLGALWAANPDLRDVPIPASVNSMQWVPSLEIPIGTQWMPVNASQPDPNVHPMSTGGTVTVSVVLPGATGEEIAHALARYPTLRGAFGMKQGEQGTEPAGPSDHVICTPDSEGAPRSLIGRRIARQTTTGEYWRMQREFASIIEVDPRYPAVVAPHFTGYALPEIANGPSPYPLMLWWALLLGLSSLARYEPAAWAAAIDLDSSELAVGLERVLDVAAERVPVHILDGLVG